MERISIAAEEMSVLVGVPRVEQDRLTRQTPVEVSAPGRYYRDSDIQRSSKDYEPVDKCRVFWIQILD
jgi:hypothetical protein